MAVTGDMAGVSFLGLYDIMRCRQPNATASSTIISMRQRGFIARGFLSDVA
jgi:hypothetical protein